MSRSDGEDEHDQRAIMSRRALLISSALTAMSCSSTPHTEPVATDQPSAKPTGSTTAKASPLPVQRKTFAELMKTAPPLGAPPDAPPADRTQLEEQATRFAPIYARLEQVWNEAPFGCAPEKAECLPAWERTMSVLAELTPSDVETLCGWGNATNTFVTREYGHVGFLKAAVAELQGELLAVLTAAGLADRFKPKERVLLQPCLSCVPPPPRLETYITFEEGSSTLSQDPLSKLTQVAAFFKEPGPTFEVRGHTDPKEPGDAKALSTARARAVREALVKAGVSAHRLEARAIGPILPVATSATAEGRALNRRVDFELRSA
ncbi:MAG: OmpA family protein [Polyangiaceae bacterium]|nr:OmpA family protein [Polyangiaceae bacterium]